MKNELITEMLAESGCLWTHKNPPKYHALLVSGLHSNGYINMRNIFNSSESIDTLWIITKLIAQNLIESDLTNCVVVGAAYGGILPAYLVGRHLNIPSFWTEKQDDNSQISKFDLNGKRVILVEDIITTGSTILKSMVSVRSSGGKVIEPIVCIVNRSGNNLIEGMKIVSGVSTFFKTYSENQCPWCKRGSVAIKPKIDDNWKKLISQEVL
jgi:orotate phosphoribosyltransferase